MFNGMRAHLSANQSVNSATDQEVHFDVTDADQGGFTSVVGGVLTFHVPAAGGGQYLIGFRGAWAAVAAGTICYVKVTRGLQTLYAFKEDQGLEGQAMANMRGETLFLLEAGDQVQYFVKQSAGAARDLLGGSDGREASAYLLWIGP